MYQLITTILLLGDFVWWHGTDRRIRRMPAQAWRRILRGGVAAFALFQITWALHLLFAPFVPRHDDWPIDRVLNVISYAWHILAIPPVLIGRLIADLARVAAKRRRAPEPVTDLPQPAFSRRALLHAAAIATPPLLAGGAAAYALHQLGHFRVRRITVPLAALPRALDGLTIVQVSDTHIGRFTNDALLDQVVSVTRSLDPDLMLFTGDLIDLSQADLTPALRMARQLRGRFGAVFIEGNHDLIQDTSLGTDRFGPALQDAGLTLLRNRSTMLRVRDWPVQVLGVRWHRGQKLADETQALMASVDPSALAILMTHHPHAFDASTVPLTLAGHTHGGQLMLTEQLGAGPVFFRYWTGLYRRGDQALVVTNGVGNWFPVRIQAPAEITHLTLRCV